LRDARRAVVAAEVVEGPTDRNAEVTETALSFRTAARVRGAAAREILGRIARLGSSRIGARIAVVAITRDTGRCAPTGHEAIAVGVGAGSPGLASGSFDGQRVRRSQDERERERDGANTKKATIHGSRSTANAVVCALLWAHLDPRVHTRAGFPP
jgi:hypothetical protein